MSGATPHGGDPNAPTSPIGNGAAPPAGAARRRGAPARRRAGPPRWQGYTPRGRPAARGATGITFRGQQPGEQAIFVARRHILFLLVGAWPAALPLIAIGLLLLSHTANARIAAGFFLLEVALGVIAAIFVLKWLAVDLVNWIFDIYILTDRRLMDAEGFINPRRKEAPLDRIQQVQVDRTNLFEYVFDYGDVVIVTAGTQGDLRFVGVPHPREKADQIREAERGYQAGARIASAPAEPRNPAVKRVLDEYAKPVVVPQQAGIPRRTFLGLLRRQSMVRFFDDEVIVAYIMRHWFILVSREALPAAITVVSVVAALVMALTLHVLIWPIALVGALGGIIFGALVYLNYVDDIFVLTSSRIIDIDRFLFVFFEGRKQAEYSKVQDVRVEVTSLLGRILGYGDITVETAGRLPNIEMSAIPNPFAVQDLIFSRINAVKERDAAAAANRQRQENRRVLAALMNEVLIEVPDVRRLPVVDAGERIAAAGLRIVVDSERRMPGWLPGLVVDQMPRAATTAVADSEVRVVLSGRA